MAYHINLRMGIKIHLFNGAYLLSNPLALTNHIRLLLFLLIQTLLQILFYNLPTSARRFLVRGKIRLLRDLIHIYYRVWCHLFLHILPYNGVKGNRKNQLMGLHGFILNLQNVKFIIYFIIFRILPRNLL